MEKVLIIGMTETVSSNLAGFILANTDITRFIYYGE